MKLQQVLKALPEVKKLLELTLPIEKAYKVYQLAKQLDDQRAFFIAEEAKLVEKFSCTTNEDGSINFPSEKAKTNFIKEYTELTEYSPCEIKAVELNITDLKGVDFTPLGLAMLEGLILFID